MYLEYFGLLKAPFHITPDPDFLYMSPSHREAFAALVYGVEQRKGFISVTGEVGAGKTTILRAFMKRVDENAVRPVYLFNPVLTFQELLTLTLRGLGATPESGQSAAELLDQLNWKLVEEYRAGRNVVLIVDEAQNMPVETLEQMRMLSNLETSSDKLLQIVLVGQPELEDKLNLHELRQLKQRCAVRSVVKPLTRDESVEYITHRLRTAGCPREEVFSPAATKAIVRHANGSPRTINIICDNAMIASFGSQQELISAAIVRAVIRDMNATSRARRAPRWGWAAAMAAGGVIVGAVVSQVGLLGGSSNAHTGATPVEASADTTPAASIKTLPAPPTPINIPAPAAAAAVTGNPATAPAAPVPPTAAPAPPAAPEKMVVAAVTPTPAPAAEAKPEVATKPVPETQKPADAAPKLEVPAPKPIEIAKPVTTPEAPKPVEMAKTATTEALKPVETPKESPKPVVATNATEAPKAEMPSPQPPSAVESVGAALAEHRSEDNAKPAAHIQLAKNTPNPADTAKVDAKSVPDAVVSEAAAKPEPAAEPKADPPSEKKKKHVTTVAMATKPVPVVNAPAPAAEPTIKAADPVAAPATPAEVLAAPPLAEAQVLSRRVVANGDCLSRLAREVYGTGDGALVAALHRYNPTIVNPDYILPGQTVVFPVATLVGAKTAAGSVATTANAAPAGGASP